MRLRGLIVLGAMLLADGQPSLPPLRAVVPLEPNVGQAPDDVAVVVHEGHSVFLISSCGVRGAAELSFVGAAHVPVRFEEPLAGVVNYFIGDDPSRWRTGVATYGRATFHDVWPGIDVAWHSERGHPEYDFVVQAGVDPAIIRVEGAHGQALSLYQSSADGTRSRVSGAWRDDGSFEIGAYDRSRALVIDPILFSELIGGTLLDTPNGMVFDVSGIYLTGATASADFPVTDSSMLKGVQDGFVVKLSSGAQPVYASYFGGSGFDYGSHLGVDSSGNAIVVGSTYSADFPQVAALQGFGGNVDAFVARFSSMGVLTYSTYLGGSSADFGEDVAVTAMGEAYVVGRTGSSDFPTVSALQRDGGSGNDAFVVRLTAAPSIFFSTYLGGSGDDNAFAVALDGIGRVYVGGNTDSTNFPVTQGAWHTALNGSSADGFVLRLNATGSVLDYATYLGGTGADSVTSIAADSAGNAIAVGRTSSPNFPSFNAEQPTLLGTQDAFVTSIANGGAGPVFSTYLGGSALDEASGVAVAPGDNVWVVGRTFSTDFPLQEEEQPNRATGALSDGFVTTFDKRGSMQFSGTLGGSQDDVATDVWAESADTAFVTGTTRSNDFMGTTSPLSVDGFIVKLRVPTPTVSDGGVDGGADAGAVDGGAPGDGGVAPDAGKPLDAGALVDGGLPADGGITVARDVVILTGCGAAPGLPLLVLALLRVRGLGASRRRF